MINKKNFDIFLTIYLILNIFFVSIFINIIGLKYFSFVLFILSFINIFIIIFSSYFNFNNFRKIYLIIIFMAIFSLISVIFSYDRSVALFGTKIRGEGFFQIMYYYSIFTLSSFVDKKHIKSILFAFIFCCVLQSINVFYDTSQTLFKSSALLKAHGFSSHNNFLGTYMLMGTLIVYSMILYEENISKKQFLLWILLYLIILYGFFRTQCFSCFLSFSVFQFLLFIVLILKKEFIKLKKMLLLLFVTFVLLISLTYFKQTDLINRFINFQKESSEIVKGNFDDSFGTDRAYIWKRFSKFILPNLYNGIGVDNIMFIDDGKPICRILSYNKTTRCTDKAHNEFYNLLLTEGIFSLIVCIIFLFNVIKACIKSKNIVINSIILFTICGYLLQSLFNIRVIEVAPIFYILCGLVFTDTNIIYSNDSCKLICSSSVSSIECTSEN